MLHRDEAYYFGVLRSYIKPDSRRKSDIDDKDGLRDVFLEAINVLMTETEINAHLRFLASHVLWQYFITEPEKLDQALKIVAANSSSRSRNVFSIFEELVRFHSPTKNHNVFRNKAVDQRHGSAADKSINQCHMDQLSIDLVASSGIDSCRILEIDSQKESDIVNISAPNDQTSASTLLPINHLPVSDTSSYVFPLSVVDLSIFNGYINVSTDFATAFVRYILPLILQSLIIRRRDTILDPYQHLFVLKNGLDKLVKLPPDTRPISILELKDLLKEIEIKIVRRYWDSRFSGCAELAIDCYRAVLRALEKELIDIGSLIDRYSDNDRYPWYLRGKYRLLAVLVEYCSLEQLLKCEYQLLKFLGRGLSATHVAPFSSSVYKTVLNVFAQKHSRHSDLLAEPLKKWTIAVVDYLLSDNRLLAMHTSKYWVPAVAKFVPDGCQWVLGTLIGKIEDADRNCGNFVTLDTFVIDGLCDLDLTKLDGDEAPSVDDDDPSETKTAWIIWACMLIRRHGWKWLRDLPPMEDKERSVGLRHLEDDVRVETFSLLLDVSAKYAPLCPIEYETVSQFIFDNLIVASSSFRRRLLAAYGKWIRASVDYYAKLVDRRDDALIPFRHFVIDLLLIPIFDQLFPGANYQRLTTVLGILQSTLDCLKLHESLWALLDIDQTVVENRTFGLQLLRCLHNSFEEIRRRSSLLLKSYFKYPFGSSPLDLQIVGELCSAASTLCRSPKAIDCDTGCIILEVIIEMLLLDNRCEIHLDFAFSAHIQQPSATGSTSIDQFFADLLQIIQIDFRKLQADMRAAAADTPAHGWALVLARFLEIVRIKSTRSISATVRAECLDAACRIIDFMLTALGSPSEGLCPSLAEMQSAIVTTAATSGYGDGLEEDPSIPLDEQLVLACCWLNIKAFAAVLAELAAYSLAYDYNQDSDPAGRIFICQIGFALFDAMSRTRHFGALEGCNLAFSKYLRLCMASDRTEVNEIPMKLLNKILEHVSEPKHVSITRRAVGFAIMIECIAVAGCSMKKRQYLETAFSRLLTITESGLNQQLHDQDEKSDVNIVRAMHCLRLLLRSSSLDLDVLPYVSACYRLAVHQFSNPLWSIRNSAMLILSSLLWRLFGRREVKQDDEFSVHSENRMDLVEFCADFDGIWKFFCASLTQIANEDKVDVDARLFALLSFAQNLIVTDLDDNQELTQEVNGVIAHLVDLLFRTPDSRLKRVIAEILANFVPKVGDKRRIFFGSVRQYAKKKERLEMNDRMALVHLMNAMKLKSGHLPLQRTEESRLPDTCNPVEICRWLRSELCTKSNTCSSDSALLINLVNGHGGLSAQCMALPVLAKYFSEHSSRKALDEQEMKLRYIDLSNWISVFAGERQIETRRLAAACSLFYVRSSVSGYQMLEMYDELLDLANARLYMSLIILLSDEDEMVRYVAAKAVMVGRALEESLSPVLCLKKLFMECASHLHSAVSRLVLGNVLGIDDDAISTEKLSVIVEKANSICREKNFLFAQQDFNIYKEEYFHLRVCFEALFAELSSRSNEKRIQWSERTKPAPIELMKLCVKALEKMRGDIHGQRRSEESVFLIAFRVLLRKRLLDLTLGHESAASDDNEIYKLLRSRLRQIFRVGDRMCACGDF